MRHSPGAQGTITGAFVPVCSCGWSATYTRNDSHDALQQAQAHAKDKRLQPYQPTLQTTGPDVFDRRDQ